MHNVEATTIDEAYIKLVNKVYAKGFKVKDERGQETRELLNILTTVYTPCINTHFGFYDLPVYKTVKPPKGTFWTGERLEKYCEEFISPERKGFVYTYGNRYRDWFGHNDQIKFAIERLNNCNETRRAISITWDPLTDSVNDEVPCMIFVDFKIRDGVLYTAATWRSHDIYGAWFANVVGLTYLAQYVADNVCLKDMGHNSLSVGPVTVYSVSGHIYENDLESAKNLMLNNHELVFK